MAAAAESEFPFGSKLSPQSETAPHRATAPTQGDTEPQHGSAPEAEFELVRSLRNCLEDLQAAANLGADSVLVLGASSSEVMGQRIGTATSLAIGKLLVAETLAFAEQTGCQVAFQCCEHLNRALVVSRPLMRRRGWREVSAVPVPGAGGAMAAQAYQLLDQACLVETVEADAGIDIGDTLIGMHLRRVAVPVRGRTNRIGQAHVTMARTRPPLIGGERAMYDPVAAARRLSTLAHGQPATAGPQGSQSQPESGAQPASPPSDC